MNPYEAFPHVVAPASAERREPASGGGGHWSSVLIFRLLSAAEALVKGLRPAGPGR